MGILMDEFEIAATEQAVKKYTAEERRRAFINGAKWLVERLDRCLEVHPMEGYAPIGYLEEARAKNFRKLLETVRNYKLEEQTKPEGEE